MARIVYFASPSGRVQGGIKMVLRHVETLRELGFDAVFTTTEDAQLPTWMDFTAPVVRKLRVMPDDILVVPEDSPAPIGSAAQRPPGSRSVIFCQNQYLLAAGGLKAVDAFAETRPLTFVAVGENQAAVLRRIYPEATVEVIPCFADERRFGPAAERSGAIAYVPKKRLFEPRAIRGFFDKLHPRHADREWIELTGRTEAEVARTFATSALYLSLSRFESVGMATLEALASGCVCAGFTGVAGEEYATAANGFWVPEDDCLGAADALAQAADLVAAGGPALAQYLEAARETAAAWSYARFRTRLEEVWMRLAPETRVRNGPLD
jgi:hypothetical protein